MSDNPNDRWEEKWKEGNTPWDLGGPHPALNTLWRRLEPLSRKGLWWVPGCGQGHEAAFLARKGLKVVGADFSPSAIEVASKSYGHLCTFEVADALTTADAPTFDGVLDRAMWCALNPTLWEKYLLACRSRLRPGGAFLSIAFGAVTDIEEGPPFSIEENQIRELLDGVGFDLEILESHPWAGEGLSFIQSEWWVVARRKE